MSVLPVLLTAAGAKTIANAVGARENNEFDDAVFTSLTYEWDRQIRLAAQAGDCRITISIPYSIRDMRSKQAIRAHFKSLGYRMKYDHFATPGSPRKWRIRILLSWPTAQ